MFSITTIFVPVVEMVRKLVKIMKEEQAGPLKMFIRGPFIMPRGKIFY